MYLASGRPDREAILRILRWDARTETIQMLLHLRAQSMTCNRSMGYECTLNLPILDSSQFVKVYSINQPQHERHSTITFTISHTHTIETRRKIPTFPRRYPIFQKSHTKVSRRSSQISSSRKGACPYDTRARTRQARFQTSGPRWSEQRAQGDNTRTVHQNKARQSQR